MNSEELSVRAEDKSEQPSTEFSDNATEAECSDDQLEAIVGGAMIVTQRTGFPTEPWLKV